MQLIAALQSDQQELKSKKKIDSTVTILERLKNNISPTDTENFLLGTGVGTFAKVLWYPFEIISVTQQTDPSKPAYREAAKKVLGGGWRIAYRGLSSQGASSFLGSAGYLGVAMTVKDENAPVLENAFRCGMYSMVAEQISFAPTAAYIRKSRGLEPYAVSMRGWGRIFSGLVLRHTHGNPCTLGTIWGIEAGLDQVIPAEYNAASSLIAGGVGAWAVHRCGLATLAAYFSTICCNPEQTMGASWKQVLKQGIHAGGDARAFNRILISGTAFCLFRLYDQSKKKPEEPTQSPIKPLIVDYEEPRYVISHE